MRTREGTLAVICSAALALPLVFPLLGHAGSVLLGPAGDNIAFVWNTWWSPNLWAHAGGWFTPLLFAPWGSALVLHTHTLVPASVAALLSGGSPVFGTNLVLIVHLVLNGICSYGLGFRLTRSAPASLVAAVTFAWAPYMGEHLSGHFNLIAAWVLPLYVLLLLRTLEKGRHTDAALLGVVAGGIGYVDYYYAIYAVCLGALTLICRCLNLTLRREPLARWQRLLLTILGVLTLLDAAVIGGLLIGAQGSVRVGSVVISVRGIENPAAAVGFLVMLATAVTYVPGMRLRVSRQALTTDLRRLVVPILVSSLLVTPVLFAAMSLWRAGGYVSQTYLWRSAPAGVDLGTLLLGNPVGFLWGGTAASAYDRLHINGIEQVAWLGPGLIVLCAAACLCSERRQDVRSWLAVAIVFGMWAVGPRLQAFGHDLHIFMPAVLVRYVPIASNARMPGRAMVVVYLAAAMLAAIGTEALLRRQRGRLAAALIGLLVLDFLPTSPQLYRPDHPAIYDVLARQQGTGSVCELPMGLRDGFGELGRLDMRVMLYQTIHGRPITGGFVARLDPRIATAYQRDPVLGVLLRLSSGAPLAAEQTTAPSAAGDSLRAQGIRFLMLNRETAPPDLIQYLEKGLPLRTIETDGARTLYEVSVPVNASLRRRAGVRRRTA